MYADDGLRLATIDPNAIPGHLRNSILPALRRIYFDETQDPSPVPAQNEAEVSKLRAENAILRAYCETWKRRANLHSAVIYGVAKVAREQVLSMRAEREELERKYQALKRKCADLEWVSGALVLKPMLTHPCPRVPASPSPDDRPPKLIGEKRLRPDSGESSDWQGWTSSPVLPPKKRLRSSTTTPTVKLEPTN